MRWGEFVRFMDKSAKILEKAYATIMPRLPMNFNARDGFGLMELDLSLASRVARICSISSVPCR